MISTVTSQRDGGGMIPQHPEVHVIENGCISSKNIQYHHRPLDGARTCGPGGENIKFLLRKYFYNSNRL